MYDDWPQPIKRVALIGNFPPRLCGIATFTFDVHAALTTAFPDMAVDVYAMNDPGVDHAFPEAVVCALDQDDIADYNAAAHRINESGADVVIVQHEYGIFGGDSGVHLLRLLDRVSAPVVVTLHTVLEAPNSGQRAVLDALARRASKLIVMADKGREILERVNGVSSDLIAVVPHGVPDRPLVETADMKERFGFAGHDVLLTFGLLSPNKGIETVIEALPEIVAQNPDALYVVLGATHPHLVAREGEAYRDRLRALAEEKGVANSVRFIDGFLEQELLLDYLAAADIYVTPYLNEAQITSGTLSYAIALGKPVVSTPYWHANELLADDVGIIAPFGDSGAFVEAINGLLGDRVKMERMRRRAYLIGRGMIWPRLAAAYVKICEDAVIRRPVRLKSVGRDESVPSRPRLEGVERLTDGCGMIQHSIFAIPDRDHGYCVDDNCRALMLMHLIDGEDAARADELATVYASFVQHAWNGEIGRFRNFMAFDRGWLEREGSEDSFGRSLWAIGVTAGQARRADMRRWALHLFDQVAPHVLPLGSPRTLAFALIGADAVLDVHPGHSVAHTIVAEFGQRLMRLLDAVQRPGWMWFEAVLGYDNARLPEALIRAGRRLGNRDMMAKGLASLDWLDTIQRNPERLFRAVGTDSFGRAYAKPLPFDQQPLEAWATIEAAALAFDETGETRWVETAWAAYRWYRGANDIGLPIGSPEDGGCFDGLMSDRVNLNQGAESVLAFQFACCGMARLLKAAEKPRGRRDLAGDLRYR
ncbi:glycosyltransferase family 4 protein [Sphingomonas profundi]|uniref:glycosyltransferase family 4 protein n=1 Tax=Alterirhizorhabdus profundi TaxID=2681549 RepID=UPI0012E94CE0|nr:glycosyltransferase family 4 protein [Sphingomonas profundi]